jgi:hypothetical protein
MAFSAITAFAVAPVAASPTRAVVFISHVRLAGHCWCHRRWRRNADIGDRRRACGSQDSIRFRLHDRCLRLRIADHRSAARRFRDRGLDLRCLRLGNGCGGAASARWRGGCRGLRRRARIDRSRRRFHARRVALRGRYAPRARALCRGWSIFAGVVARIAARGRS